MIDETNHPDAEPDEHPEHYLREWREFMHWSQEELGEMANVHFSKISRIENGKRSLKAGFLRQLGDIFKVPPSAILEINPATKEGAQTAELLQAWHDLDPEKKSNVLTMVRALSTKHPQGNAS